MRSLHLVESRPTVLAITDAEADALSRAGNRLASDRRWWGDEVPTADRTVISCVQVDNGQWSVTVRDAIGLVVVESSLQLTVAPKIPMAHLLYLAERAKYVPRLDPQRATKKKAESLWELVAEWFVGALEGLMRRDFLRDYEEVLDESPAARGLIRPLDTAVAFYNGRLVMVCEFDEFGFDTPLNRVLRAAMALVVSSPYLRAPLRDSARRLLWRMDEVGSLRSDDLRVRPDRRSAHYADALILARHVLQGAGRSLEHGVEPVWTFLIRTPTLVEEGILQVLTACSSVRVMKRGLQLQGSTLTVNPDLVFEEGPNVVAVGDVKYKIASEEWRRGDLYQVVAFGTAYRVSQAALCDFLVGDGIALQPVAVGDLKVHHFAWRATEERSPVESAELLVKQVDEWGDGAVRTLRLASVA